MECGEFDKRNKEYFKKYTKESYFQNLLSLKDEKNINLLKGEGRVIFDVGAHAGESANFFNEIFPLAQIYSFEPNPKMAKALRKLRPPCFGTDEWMNNMDSSYKLEAIMRWRGVVPK